jgi:hypothetical protein
LPVRARTLFPALAILLAACPFARAQDWIAPPPAELAMTAQPEVPGAAAVYLNRDVLYDDVNHERKVYARIKILTDAGKQQADVEVSFYGGSGGFFGDSGYHVDQVAGRTIHPDGSIVPFTGKPLEKLVEKGSGYKIKSKVFTLPAVEVGSIIEYRYRIRYEGDTVIPPKWYLATDLYTRSGHFVWKPYRGGVSSGGCGGGFTYTAAWYSALPPGVTVDAKKTPEHPHASVSNIELSFHDIPPIKTEEFMPPIESLGYRVFFYYMSINSAADYWKRAGACWSAGFDAYIGPGDRVKAFVPTIVAPSDSSENKLRKFYAAIMDMENTDYTRQLTEHEEKAKGLHAIENTEDVLLQKRGNSRQLTALFIAMARAAGFKAYLMAVADRSERIFQENFLSLDQLDDFIAIVEVDGKERFFDPGTRFCSFGHLHWHNTYTKGLRQLAGGTSGLAITPGGGLQDTRVDRVASLTLDRTGHMEGMLQFTYTGDAALYWRQRALLGDDNSLQRELREDVEDLFPSGTEVKVVKVENQTGYELPLLVSFQVKGDLATHAGKRLVISADLFEAKTKPHFTLEKREFPIDMHYPSYRKDAIRILLPASFTLESSPSDQHISLPQRAAYQFATEQTPSSITLGRDLLSGIVFLSPAQYPDLHSFYNKLQTKDQESVVLVPAPGK